MRADAAAEDDPAETGVAATVAPDAVVAIPNSLGGVFRRGLRQSVSVSLKG